MARVHTQQICRWYQTGSSGRCTGQLWHRSEGPGWAGEMDQQKSHKDQQRQMPSAAPGEAQPHTPAQAGGDQLKSSIAGKDLRFLVNKLKTSQQWALAAKTNSILGCTRKSITSLSREVIFPNFPKFSQSYRSDSPY